MPRASFPGTSLDALYDQDSMPPVLRKAHSALDKAVDRLYRLKAFKFERERVEHLFEIYEKSAAPIDDTKAKQNRPKLVA
jgi:hypothetical protein